MRVAVLGVLELDDGDSAVDAGPPLQRALLALLVSRRDHVVAVDTIWRRSSFPVPPSRTRV